MHSLVTRRLVAYNLIGVWTMALVGLAIRLSSAAPTHDRNSELTSYTDTFTMWDRRGVDQHIFPYVNGHFIAPHHLTSGTVEYPVLLGVIIWATALFAHSYVQFLVVTTLFNALAASVVAILLVDLVGSKSLWWSWCPALLVYLPYNWDVLPALTSIVALWVVFRAPPEWSVRKRGIVAAVALGIGCAIKIYPGIMLLPLALWVAQAQGTPRRKTWRDAALVLASGVGVVVAANLPFMLINPSGWMAPFSFQSVRPLSTDTLSSWLLATKVLGTGHFTPAQTATITTLSTLTALAVAALAAGIGWYRRHSSPAGYPIAAVSAAMTAGFMLANKVDSPQYILWVLPLLLLLPVSRVLVAAYVFADLVIFWWFFTFMHAPAGLTTNILYLLIAATLASLTAIYVTALARLDGSHLQRKSMSSIPEGSGSSGKAVLST